MEVLVKHSFWFLILILAAGCSTTSDIVATPQAAGKQYHTAYLVAHGDKSSDVDAAIQRELFRRGFVMSSGAEGKQPENADLIVRYADGWSWDVVMYLAKLDIQVYDAKGGGMIASATWKNSAMHGFHDLDKIADELVGGMLKKMGVAPAMPGLR
jgi:hypothetical protein